MADNATRHSQRAAAGLSKAVRREYVPPDTQIVGPDGTLRFLGRRGESQDPVIAFHKYNPTRRDARSGKRSKPGAAGAAAAAASSAALRGGGGSSSKGFGFGPGSRTDAGGGPLGGLLRRPMDLINRVPFMHLVLTAALAHRVWTFVTRRFFGGGGGGGAAARGGDRQLARRAAGGEDDEDDDDEYELDEHAEELLGQMQHASMLPTMLRASLPRHHRASLAKRAAQQYHSRPRGHRTAHQMMHGGPAAATANAGAIGGGAGGGGGKPAGGAGRRQAQRRPLGKLEKMDLIVRQQVRAAMLAQQQQQQQVLQQQLGVLEPGPSAGTRLALPAAAAVPSAGMNSALSGAGHQYRPPARLPPPQQQQHPNGDAAASHGPSSGALVPAAIAVAAAAVGASPALPHRLQAGPPAPPAFRPLPLELRSRMAGVRHPGAAAMAPAARAAAAGPPLTGLRESQAAHSADGGLDAAAAAPGPATSGSGAGAGTGAGGASWRADAGTSGAAAEGEVGSEGSELRLVVPRVAGGVRTVKKAVG